MSTIGELNNTLQNKIDLSEENNISSPIKKDNEIILDNKKEIPSIANVVKHLQYNYEVLEIRKDYQGTLENLMRQQGKKIPKYLPFINLFLVGGGSSGGWIKDPSDETIWYGSGYWGNTNFYYLNNIDLKSNINIKIGKGGASIPKTMNASSFYSTNNDWLPNLGGITIFNYNDLSIQTSEPEIKNIENYKTDKVFVVKPLYTTGSGSNTNLNVDRELSFNLNNVKKENCNLKNSDIYIPHNYNYASGLGFVIQNRVKSWYPVFTSNFLEQSYNIWTNIYANNVDIYKKYLENIMYNFSRRPELVGRRQYKINSYGATGKEYVGDGEIIDAVFFDGMDVLDIGMPGLPGSKSCYISDFVDEPYDGKAIYSYQRGYCGKGGDGACFIYYPKEV